MIAMGCKVIRRRPVHFHAEALVDQLTQAVHVNRMESQDDLESAMRVSVGLGARLCPSPSSYISEINTVCISETI